MEIGVLRPKLDVIPHADNGDLGARAQSGKLTKVGLDQDTTRLVQRLEVGTPEDSSGELSAASVLRLPDDFGGMCLEVGDCGNRELTVLAFGDDTPVFETTAKTGGHHNPSLVIQTVEVLTEEHFCPLPSVFICLTLS